MSDFSSFAQDAEKAHRLLAAINGDVQPHRAVITDLEPTPAPTAYGDNWGEAL